MYPRVVSHTWLWRRTPREGKPSCHGPQMLCNGPWEYRHLVPDAPEAQSYTNLTRKVHRAIAHASLRRSGFTGVYRLSYRSSASLLRYALVCRCPIHSNPLQTDALRVPRRPTKAL